MSVKEIFTKILSQIDQYNNEGGQSEKMLYPFDGIFSRVDIKKKDLLEKLSYKLDGFLINGLKVLRFVSWETYREYTPIIDLLLHHPRPNIQLATIEYLIDNPDLWIKSFTLGEIKNHNIKAAIPKLLSVLDDLDCSEFEALNISRVLFKLVDHEQFSLDLIKKLANQDPIKRIQAFRMLPFMKFDGIIPERMVPQFEKQLRTSIGTLSNIEFFKKPTSHLPMLAVSFLSKIDFIPKTIIHNLNKQIRMSLGIYFDSEYFSTSQEQEETINYQLFTKLLDNINSKISSRIYKLVEQRFNPCVGEDDYLGLIPTEELPINCFDTVLWSLFEERSTDETHLLSQIKSNNYKMVKEIRPFHIKDGYIYGLNNEAIQEAYESLTAGDVLMFKNSRDNLKYYHTAYYLGKFDAEHYMFQKPNSTCGKLSNYGVKTVRSYIEEHIYSRLGKKNRFEILSNF